MPTKKEKLQNTKILIVDDDRFTLEMLKIIFNKEVEEVVSAWGGEEARKILEEKGASDFDCVLTDFRMPDITGLDLLEFIRHQDPTLAVMIFTAEGERDMVTKSFRAGAYDFIEKPFKPQEVRQAVRGAIQFTRKRRSVEDIKAPITCEKLKPSAKKAH